MGLKTQGKVKKKDNKNKTCFRESGNPVTLKNILSCAREERYCIHSKRSQEERARPPLHLPTLLHVGSVFKKEHILFNLFFFFRAFHASHLKNDTIQSQL
jgi:hypothetical protein